ncbi:MAG: hypothetical protein AAB360_01675 [Patescibacteria group bacterium]
MRVIVLAALIVGIGGVAQAALPDAAIYCWDPWPGWSGPARQPPAGHFYGRLPAAVVGGVWRWERGRPKPHNAVHLAGTWVEYTCAAGKYSIVRRLDCGNPSWGCWGETKKAETFLSVSATLTPGVQPAPAPSLQPCPAPVVNVTAPPAQVTVISPQERARVPMVGWKPSAPARTVAVGTRTVTTRPLIRTAAILGRRVPSQTKIINPKQAGTFKSGIGPPPLSWDPALNVPGSWSGVGGTTLPGYDGPTAPPLPPPSNLNGGIQ